MKPEFIRGLRDVMAKIGYGLLAVIVLLVIIPWLLPDDWPIKYAMQENVNRDNISIDKKPHDCDWDSSPLGDKHCHYKSQMTFYDGKYGDANKKLTVSWQRVED